MQGLAGPGGATDVAVSPRIAPHLQIGTTPNAARYACSGRRTCSLGLGDRYVVITLRSRADDAP